MLRTSPEAYALYLAKTTGTTPKREPQPKLDHVPTPQEVLAIQLRDAGISFLYDSFHFHPSRNYRADFAIPSHNPFLLVECDGNGTNGHPGAHRSRKGYEADRERDAAALLLGFTVLRVVPAHVLDGTALYWVQQLIARKNRNE